MVVDRSIIGLNKRIIAGKSELTYEDVPKGMWEKYVAKQDIKDAIVYHRGPVFVPTDGAPCPPLDVDCSSCLFGLRCVSSENSSRVKILEELFNGGKLTWTK